MTDPVARSDDPPSAFVSYAQSHPDWDRLATEKWRTTVLQFATLLCELGIDAEVDQFHGHALDVDWNRFGTLQIAQSDFIIIAVSAAYRERWEGRNDPGDGPGAVREADELLGLFNENQAEFRRRVMLVVLPGAQDQDVPAQLSGIKRFKVRELTEEGVEDLYRTITNQPATPKPALGPIRRLPPREIYPAQELAVSAAEKTAEPEEVRELRVALARVEGALEDIPQDIRVQARHGNFSLPWVRAAHQLDAEHQAILGRLARLEAAQAESAPAPRPRLARLIAEIFESIGEPARADVVDEIVRRLEDPHAGPETLRRLLTDLPGRDPSIGVQKRVKAELFSAGVLERNPHGQGWLVARAARHNLETVLRAIGQLDSLQGGGRAEIRVNQLAAHLGCPADDPDLQRSLAEAVRVGAIEKLSEVDQLEGPTLFRLVG